MATRTRPHKAAPAIQELARTEVVAIAPSGARMSGDDLLRLAQYALNVYPHSWLGSRAPDGFARDRASGALPGHPGDAGRHRGLPQGGRVFASHELGLSPDGCHVLAAALECITAKLKPLDTSGWRLVTRKGGVYAHP